MLLLLRLSIYIFFKKLIILLVTIELLIFLLPAFNVMSYDYQALLLEPESNAEQIDDVFLYSLYFYYYHGGYYNIIINDILDILISVFLMFFFNFLTMCINYKGLFQNKGNHSIMEFIDFGNFWKLSWFMKLCFVIFTLYIIIKIIQTIANIKNHKKTRKLYRDKLHIRDMEIRNYTWGQIMDKVIETHHSIINVNVYTVTNRIMKTDNILISLFDNDILSFNYMNHLLEWNIKFCFLNSLQKGKTKISPEMVTDRKKYKTMVQHRIIAIGIINFIFGLCIPVIPLFATFYTFIKHGERFYTNPSSITKRYWTNQRRWKNRFYNELPHIFNSRMAESSTKMEIYFHQFNNRLLEIISRFIVFIASSFFLFLVFIVFINENNLNNKGFFGFQPVLWYITILTIILAIFRQFTKSNISTHPKESLMEANEDLLIIPDEYIEHARTETVRRKLENYFEFHASYLLKEILYIPFTFVYMIYLYYESNKITNFILNSLEEHVLFGYGSEYGYFNNYNDDNLKKSKLRHSKQYFIKCHPSSEQYFGETKNRVLPMPDPSVLEKKNDSDIEIQIDD